MRISELAKELGATSEQIIDKLKSLRLRVKDRMSDLDERVLAVIKSEFKKDKEIKKVSLESKEKIKPFVKPIEKAPQKRLGEVKPKEKLIKEKPKAILKEKPKETPQLLPEKVKPKKKVFEKFKKIIKERQKVAPKEKIREPQKEPLIVSREVTRKVGLPETKITAVKEPPKPKVHPKKFEPITKKELIEEAAKIVRPLKEIQIEFPISVKDLSFKLQQKPSSIIKKLLDLKIIATINQAINEETANKVSKDFGFVLTRLPSQEESLISLHEKEDLDKSQLAPRSPVVTFMGHVDHGKTSLLDMIRKSKITEKEHGGITQHIGAYEVKVKDNKITFLDTPGHEAFTAMRARGANITDIVVLVVAADEGIMPQTIEAIDHARVANVPIIVALNKIDKPGIDIDMVKKQLQEHNLLAEDWGGKTITVGVSAKTGEGIDRLLEMILLEAEMLELKANYKKLASGVIVDAKLTKDRGAVVTVIVQNGILHIGDLVIAGDYYGKIKAMFNDRQIMITEAPPSTPVEIVGLSNVPEPGERLFVIDDEKKAKDICQQRLEKKKFLQTQPVKRISLEDLYSQIKEGKIKELKIILKVDVGGSLEALRDSLAKLPTNEVKLEIIHAGLGSINTSDVLLATVSDAVIIGFHVDIDIAAKEEADRQGVDVRTYRIIYDAINDIKQALEGLLEPKIKKNFLGRVEIRQVFKLSRSGIVAGCFVAKGKINRTAHIELVRNGAVIFEGKLASLKRFKDDVREVLEGFECGLTLSGFDDIAVGDVVEAFEIEKIARTL